MAGGTSMKSVLAGILNANELLKNPRKFKKGGTGQEPVKPDWYL